MRKLWMVLLLLLAFTLSAQDPAKVATDVYKCILENEQVRVCEITIRSGASVPVHSHPGHVIYVTAPGRLRITPVGGAPMEVDFKAGQAVWAVPEAHSAVNTGKTDLRGLIVEVKSATGGTDPVASAILQMERDWAAAMVAGDLARLEGIMARDWLLTDPMGQVVTREQALADLRTGALRFESTVPTDLKVTVYGDTAIVKALTVDKGTYKGTDISGKYAVTDVFLKRDGAWRAVSTHVTRVAVQE